MSRRKKRRMGQAPEVARPAVDAVEFDIVDDMPASPHAVNVVVGTRKTDRVPVPSLPPGADPPHRRPTVGESKRNVRPKTPPPPARAARPPAVPTGPSFAPAESIAADTTRVHAIAPRDPDTDAESESRHDVHTVGELLQQAREARGLSLQETSARTRIALKMLRHLENDHFDEFPADAYVKGFLRSYGGFLGLEVGMLIRRYEAFAGRLSAAATPEVWEENDEPVEPRERRRLPVQGRVLAAVGGGVALVVLAWVLWSQGFGLRPTGGLESIEKDLRGAQTPVEPQAASVDREGVVDSLLTVDGTGVAPREDAAARVPAVTPVSPANPGGEAVHEDTAPRPPVVPLKPVVTPTDSNRQSSQRESPPPAVSTPTPLKNTPAATSPKPAKRAKKPEPKPEPRTSPEDAAGPPR